MADTAGPPADGGESGAGAGPTVQRRGSGGTHAKFRETELNDRAKNDATIAHDGFTGNTVSTSKYNGLSFLPKNLLEFFRVRANQYFLVISILQVSTDLSPTNPYTTITPLTIVLLITMLKQFLEDLKRHQADTKMNNRRATVVKEGGRLSVVAWRDVQVGDIIVVRDREELPADIMLLASSEEEGRCFIETANLDGETNLKRRQAVEATCKRVGWRAQGDPPLDAKALYANAAKLGGVLQYEDKNNSLYTFTGTLRLAGAESPVPVGPPQVVLRGCMLRSCHFVLGFVLYTGADTKLMQNSRPAPSKQSNVYKMVNRCIMLIFLTQFGLCVISTIMFAVWSTEHEGAGVAWYMGNVLEEVLAGDVVLSFFTFLILYNNLVPISLYVSLDMIKVIQAKMIEHDPNMCYTDEVTGDTKPAKARTSDLNEDLGQIEYIFSDKTGTLTRNMMEFRKCSIGGVAYGFGTTEIGEAAMKRQAEGGAAAAEVDADAPVGVTGMTAAQVEALSDPVKAQVNHDPLIHFDDPRLLEAVRKRGSSEAGMAVHEFLTLLAVCHTVIPEKDPETGAVAYRAASPDEEALVKAAKCLGYDFKTAAPTVEVEMRTEAGGPATQDVFEILNINEFNSTRKRMSVVVRTSDGRYVLYCKGADNVMCKRSTSVMGSDWAELTSHLRAFASEGLRTLVLASRQLTEAEYTAWNASYAEAAASMVDREERLMEVAEAIEVNMAVIGATAIEDKLQEGVPQCIADLAEAGIKIWVLTGDKQETAINIGYACRLLTNEMHLIYVNAEHLEDIESQLTSLQKEPLIAQLIASEETSDHVALIMDGSSLTKIFASRDMSERRKAVCVALQKQLLAVARCCKAVVACRVSPAQKAAIVDLVRKNVTPAPMTLAIGDGANDVNMIQTAQVGIGISGQEGVQAVNSSDYAIAQFKYLKTLLLVHGRLNYQRVAKVILYSFYKNIALVMVLFLFNFYNGFSGTTLFESFVMAGWNFFLAMPIIIIGIVDQDVHDAHSMNNPALYLSGQWSLDLNLRKFTIWIVNAFVHAFVTFLLPLPTLYCIWDGDGQADGLMVYGTAVYTCLLMTMNYKVALETRVWTLGSHFFWWGSVLLYVVFLCIYTLISDSLGQAVFLNAAYAMFARPAFWLLTLMVPMVAILCDVGYGHWQSQTNPPPHEVLREAVRYDAEPTAAYPHRAALTKEGAGAGGKVTPAPGAEAVDLDKSIREFGSTVRGVVNLKDHQPTGFAYNSPVNESHYASRGGMRAAVFAGKLLGSVRDMAASSRSGGVVVTGHTDSELEDDGSRSGGADTDAAGETKDSR